MLGNDIIGAATYLGTRLVGAEEQRNDGQERLWELSRLLEKPFSARTTTYDVARYKRLLSEVEQIVDALREATAVASLYADAREQTEAQGVGDKFVAATSRAMLVQSLADVDVF